MRRSAHVLLLWHLCTVPASADGKLLSAEELTHCRHSDGNCASSTSYEDDELRRLSDSPEVLEAVSEDFGGDERILGEAGGTSGTSIPMSFAGSFPSAIPSMAVELQPPASPPPPFACTYGCTLKISPNYDELASCEDGSCERPDQLGCTTPGQIGYAPGNQRDTVPTSCIPARFGCYKHAPGGVGYDWWIAQNETEYPTVFAEPIGCGAVVPCTCDRDCQCEDYGGSAGTIGCMDESAIGYVASNWRDTVPSSCIQKVIGCTKEIAINFDSNANFACDETGESCCEYGRHGCTDSLALNYNSIFSLPATTVVGQCKYEVLGCTSQKAVNYQYDATMSDGSCVVLPAPFSKCPLSYTCEPTADGSNVTCSYTYDDECFADMTESACFEPECTRYMRVAPPASPPSPGEELGSGDLEDELDVAAWCAKLTGTDLRNDLFGSDGEPEPRWCWYIGKNFGQAACDESYIGEKPTNTYPNGRKRPCQFIPDPTHWHGGRCRATDVRLDCVGLTATESSTEGECAVNSIFRNDATELTRELMMNKCEDADASNGSAVEWFNDFCNGDADPLGKCLPAITGCTDEKASNYNSSAKVDDLSCVYKKSGCADSSAKYSNYCETCDIHIPSTCRLIDIGCMIPYAGNYDPNAKRQYQGVCAIPAPVVKPCDDPSARNYKPALHARAERFCDQMAAFISAGETANHPPCAMAESYGVPCNTSAVTTYADARPENQLATTQKVVTYRAILQDRKAARGYPLADDQVLHDCPVTTETCVFPKEGCTQVNAFNYDSTATITTPGITVCIPKRQGCMNSNSVNFDSRANVECDAELSAPLSSTQCPCRLPGCTEPLATNYAGPSSLFDNDGSCEFVVPGCTDSLAVNYNSSISVDDGSCNIRREGCMNSNAENFDSTANVDPGTGTADSTVCRWAIPACCDPLADTYMDGGCGTPPSAFQYYKSEPSECTYSGCKNTNALNYDPSADAHSETCDLPESGCMREWGDDFDPYHTVSVPCTKDGCMDSTALNYDSEATYQSSSSVCRACTDIPDSIWAGSPFAQFFCASVQTYITGCKDASYSNYDATASFGSSSLCLMSPSPPPPLPSPPPPSPSPPPSPGPPTPGLPSPPFSPSPSAPPPSLPSPPFSPSPSPPPPSSPSPSPQIPPSPSPPPPCTPCTNKLSPFVERRNRIDSASGYGTCRNNDCTCETTFDDNLGPWAGWVDATIEPSVPSAFWNTRRRGADFDCAQALNSSAPAYVRENSRRLCKCKYDADWVKNKWCAASCYHYGKAYDDHTEVCCPLGPSPSGGRRLASEETSLAVPSDADAGLRGGAARRLAAGAGCMDPLAITYDSTATDHDPAQCVIPVTGCADSTAFNYVPMATTDDSSCLVSMPGCTTPSASNYDSTAVQPDGSCVPFVSGCMDSTASNYMPTATSEPAGACEYKVFGCTIQTGTLNYDSNATFLFGCVFAVEGCMDSLARNFLTTATVDSSGGDVCAYVVTGCTAPYANNYDSLATQDPDGVCIYPGPVTGRPGCMDPLYDDYRTYYTTSRPCVGQLIIEGCLRPRATNYDSTANRYKEGACVFPDGGCKDPNDEMYDPSAAEDDPTACSGIRKGCTDADSLCHDKEAVVDDGSCYAPSCQGVLGCMDTLAITYEINATKHRESDCEYPPTYGCSDPTASNYVAGAVGCSDEEGPYCCTGYDPGCTDSRYGNYDPRYDVDDGTCSLRGCTISYAFNFDELATTPLDPLLAEAVCLLPVMGCMDPEAENYNSEAQADDGECRIPGCMDSYAPNYNPKATLAVIDAGVAFGGCEPPVEGCTNSLADNYFSLATMDTVQTKCILEGCMDSGAANYRPWAEVEPVPTPCDLSLSGCTDSLALNYWPDAKYERGLCEYAGCADSTYFNYDPGVDVHEWGMCVREIEGCMDPDAWYNYGGPNVNVDDGSCVYAGCLTEGRVKYDPLVNLQIYTEKYEDPLFEYCGGLALPPPPPIDFPLENAVRMQMVLEAECTKLLEMLGETEYQGMVDNLLASFYGVVQTMDVKFDAIKVQIQKCVDAERDAIDGRRLAGGISETDIVAEVDFLVPDGKTPTELVGELTQITPDQWSDALGVPVGFILICIYDADGNLRCNLPPPIPPPSPPPSPSAPPPAAPDDDKIPVMVIVIVVLAVLVVTLTIVAGYFLHRRNVRIKTSSVSPNVEQPAVVQPPPLPPTAAPPAPAYSDRVPANPPPGTTAS